MLNWLRSLDGPTIVLVITQILNAGLGVLMTADPALVSSHKRWFYTGVLVLAAFGGIATIVQFSRSAASSTKLENTLNSLSEATTETARLTNRNNELQGKLVDATQNITELGNKTVQLAAANTELTKEAIRQVTGEGGYCVVVPYYTSIDPAIVAKEKIVIPDAIPTTFRVLNNSTYRVFIVRLTIMRSTPMGEGQAFPTVTGGVLRGDMNFLFNGEIGNVYPGTGAVFVTDPKGRPAQGVLRKDRDNWFHILVTAASVKLSETLVVSWDGVSWEHAYELKRLKDDKGNTEKVLQKIRDDFPYISKSRPRR